MKNKDIAEAFKEASHFISDNFPEGDQFICCALDSAFYTDKISKDQRDQAQKIISDRMDGKATLEFWLMSNGVPLDQLIPKNMVQYRLEWLQLLFEEFSNEK